MLERLHRAIFRNLATVTIFYLTGTVVCFLVLCAILGSPWG